MPTFVFDTAVTLNGFLADEQHSLDWLFAVPGGDEPGDLQPQGVTVLVEGSSTYEWVLRHEDLLNQPTKWQEFYGDSPTFVFTSRELPGPDGADVRFVNGSVTEALPAIREAAGDGTVWVVGGGDLAAQFLEAGALDRICLSIAPATVAAGAPLLPRVLGPERLRLLTARAAGPFARLEYEVLPASGPAPVAGS